MKQILLSLLIVSFCFLPACGSSSSVDGKEETRRRDVPVTTVLAKKENVVFSSAKVGAVKVNRQVPINFSTPGRLEEFLIKEGHYVRENEVIARLDETELKANVETIKIELAELSKRREKLEGFLTKGVVTEAEYDQVNTKYLTQKEALKVARDRLSKAVVRAPFSGLLLKKLSEKGSFVPPGAPIAVLVDIDEVRVELDFSDREISKVAVGSSIDVRTDAYEERTFKGVIERIIPSVDPRSRMTRVELLIPNKDRILRPGTMVKTDVVVGAYNGVIALPVDCLVYQGKKTFVYVVEEGTNVAKRVFVKVETLYKDKAVITEGLEANDIVVESGQSYLANGSKIRILE